MTDALLKKNLIPDAVLRIAIRYLLKNRLKHERCATEQEKLSRLIEELKRSPIAMNTQDANRQHYEVPARFFEIVLGPWLKYSCGYWPEKSTSLAISEEKMLELTIERAGISNGQSILDLGCGWGSFTLFAAGRYPDAQFTAVSNSASQRRFIESRALELELQNVKVITADINDFNPDEKYDRVVSVEMFEHVRNYELLFSRIHYWLKRGEKLFVHIFNHHQHAYTFEVRSERDWMARHFFTGGMMPSKNLLFNFSDGFSSSGHWIVNGINYSKTLETWLKNMDSNKPEIMEIFDETYGDMAKQFWVYWRIFFMACSETFKMHQGNEWQVGHYLFEKK